jgi:hypothetical protein
MTKLENRMYYTSPSSETKQIVFWGVGMCSVAKEGMGGEKNKLGML